MAKGDDPRERQHYGKAGGTPAATIYTGTIMTLIAVAMLFADDEDDKDQETPSE
jgi:hypothetical protein